ncbi:MAG: hypothetical protein CMH60_03605 [Myxococcales bacterium]|nr:hypothetical protein [Myxococcales bacterium]
MRYFPASLAFLLLALNASLSFAAGLRATIDKTQATMEDQFLLTLEVEGSSRSEPTLPSMPNFDVQSRGQSSQVQIINGRMRSNVSYNYILMPKKAGTFILGPASVEVDGQKHFSKPIKLTIVPPEHIPQSNRSAFVIAEVNNPQPYVGQQVIYTFRFFRRVQIANANLDMPVFDGFIVEDMGEQKEYEIVRNGQKFVVTDVQKALFPQEAGELVIPSATLNADIFAQNQRRRRRDIFDDFFGSSRGRTQTKILRTKELVLSVKPLPESSYKSSGLIGEFDIRGALSKSELKTGESTTLSITIRGVGNIQQISKPELPNMPNVKIYEDKTTENRSMNANQLQGEKTFRWAIIPLEAGLLEIPGVTLQYFDVQTGQYKSKQSESFFLNISQGAEKEELRLTTTQKPVTQKASVEILGEDISPIHEDLSALKKSNAANQSLPLWLLYFSLPPLFFFGLFTRMQRQNKSSAQKAQERQSKAAKKAMKRIQKLGQAANQSDSGQYAQDVSEIFRDYLGDKTLLEGRALASGDISKLLEKRGIAPELCGEIQQFISLCDSLQYAGNQTQTSVDALQELPKLIKKMERQL